MKRIVLVLVVSFVATLLNGFELSDEQKAHLKASQDSCVAESGIDPTVVENAKRGIFDDENDEKLACFVTCMLKKCGMMDANDNIDWEAARAKISMHVSQDRVDSLYGACKDITGNGCRKGANLLKCVIENSLQEEKDFFLKA